VVSAPPGETFAVAHVSSLGTIYETLADSRLAVQNDNRETKNAPGGGPRERICIHVSYADRRTLLIDTDLLRERNDREMNHV
jgi:hypothetical protein